jgi:hypothetical protein
MSDSDGGPEFTSVLNVDYDQELNGPFDRSRVHVSLSVLVFDRLCFTVLITNGLQVMHGLSKDFCSSGLRYGAECLCLSLC